MSDINFLELKRLKLLSSSLLFNICSVEFQDTPPDGLKLEDDMEIDPDVKISVKEEDKR